ncbi:MAG: uncharacterized protein KVP18_004179, partial [Porospora cf. gigantea A]|uniref:uncharacterized protein n=2 Tax=Porospora cf. gigantea A TaxID=2853593 RepID=UPI00355A18DD
MDFDARKQEVLKGLDRSLKGSVDAPLCDFISAVNRHADFCSTSCCSGRATVFMSSGAPNEKNKGYMTLSSHETISTEDVNVDDPSPAYSQTPALTDVELRSAVLKFEPVVIHLEARSLERLVQLLDVARRAGLKNSGAMGLGPKRYIMAFRGSSRLEAPLLVDGQRLYTVVDPLVEEVNKRFAVNQRQIDRLVAAWEAVFGHTEEPQPAAPFPLCWAPAADGGVLRRWGHCSVVLSGLVVVIGGFGGDKVLGRQKHLAIYDPATRDWSPLETPGPAQQMGSCAVKLANDRAVVYGGRSHPGHISDEVWLLTVYSKTDAVWEPLEVEGQSPAGRHRHSGLRTSRHRVVFFGGVVSPDSGSPNGVSGDLLELTLSAGKAQWSVLSNAGPRLHSAGLLENDLGELLVIGGYRQSHLGTMSTVHTF